MAIRAKMKKKKRIEELEQRVTDLEELVHELYHIVYETPCDGEEEHIFALPEIDPKQSN